MWRPPSLTCANLELLASKRADAFSNGIMLFQRHHASLKVMKATTGVKFFLKLFVTIIKFFLFCITISFSVQKPSRPSAETFKQS